MHKARTAIIFDPRRQGKTAVTTLEEVKQRLLTLQPGDGIRLTRAELTEIEIPGISPFDLKSRAEWLRNQLPLRAPWRKA
jgi:hypothetical protein